MRYRSTQTPGGAPKGTAAELAAVVSRAALLNTATTQRAPRAHRAAANHGFAIAVILYILALMAVAGGVLFSGYSQIMMSNISITNYSAARNQVAAAQQALDNQFTQTNVSGTTTYTAETGVAFASLSSSAQLPLNSSHTTITAADMQASLSPQPDVGVLPVLGGVNQVDPWGHYYIYCWWPNGATGTGNVYSVISAGPDGVVQTNCGLNGTNAPGGDDVAALQTVQTLPNSVTTWTVDSSVGGSNQQISTGGNGGSAMVGINTDNPGYNLDVYGNTEVTGNTYLATGLGNSLYIGATLSTAGSQGVEITSAGAVTGLTSISGNIGFGSGTLTGGTLSGSTLSGGTVTGTVAASGATITSGTLSGSTLSSGTISGGTLTGTLAAGGATITSGTLSGSTLSGGTVSGGTLTGAITAASGTNITATGATITDGTLSGSTLSGGTVSGGTITGSLTATGATITNGTLSGSTLSGGALSGTLAAAGATITGNGSTQVGTSGNMVGQVNATTVNGTTVNATTVNATTINGTLVGNATSANSATSASTASSLSPGAAIALVGDATAPGVVFTGASPIALSTTVGALQGIAVASGTPTTGYVLAYNGSEWAAANPSSPGAFTFGSGDASLNSTSGDNFYIRTQTNTPNPNFELGIGNGSGGWSDVPIFWNAGDLMFSAAQSNPWCPSCGGGTTTPEMVITTGEVGINTTAPTFPLTVDSTATTNTVIAGFLAPSMGSGQTTEIDFGTAQSPNYEAGTLGYVYNSTTANSFTYLSNFGDNGAGGTGLVVRAGGNVGIGTTTPGSTLTVNGTISATNISPTSQIQLPSGSAGAPSLSFSSDTTTGIYYTASALDISVGGTQRAVFDNSGDLNLVQVGGGYELNNTKLLYYPDSDTSSLALGGSALAGQTTSSNGGNVAIGQHAGQYVSSSLDNVAVGANALQGVSGTPLTGNYNTAVGANSLLKAQGGATSNTSIGLNTLFYMTTGGQNTAVGASAMTGASASPLTGSFNTAIGQAALSVIQGGAVDNTALGQASLYKLTTGTDNTALGYNAGYYWTTGTDNIAIGSASMLGSAGTPLTGYGNIAVGDGALSAISGYANDNTAVGYQAMSNAAMSSAMTENAALGVQALSNAASSFNTALGSWAMQGTPSTPLTGQSNTAVGYKAFINAQGGATKNTIVGYQSGYALQAGTDNTTLGYQAGYSVTGNGNIVIGEVGNITSGSNNILIGNSLANTVAGSSNQIDIGDLIWGNTSAAHVGIGTTSPGTTLDVALNAGGQSEPLILRNSNSGQGASVALDFVNNYSEAVLGQIAGGVGNTGNNGGEVVIRTRNGQTGAETNGLLLYDDSNGAVDAYIGSGNALNVRNNGTNANMIQFEAGSGGDYYTWYVNSQTNGSGVGTRTLQLWYYPYDSNPGCCEGILQFNGAGTMAWNTSFPFYFGGGVYEQEAANTYVTLGVPDGAAASPNTYAGMWYDISTATLQIGALSGGAGWRNVSLIPGGQANVGIGTTSPGQKLVVYTTTSNDGLQVYNGTEWMLMAPGTVGGGSFNNIVQAGDNAIIYSAGTENTGALDIAPWSSNSTGGIHMNSSGQVGIGTASPTYDLTIQDTGSSALDGIYFENNQSGVSGQGGALMYAGSGSGYSSYASRVSLISWANSSSGTGSKGITLSMEGASEGAQDLRVVAGNSDTSPLLIVEQGGNVGIGTTAPGTLLDVGTASTNGRLRITSANSSSGGAGFILNEGDTVDGAQFNATNASFNNNLIYGNTTRSANSAFNLLNLQANGAQEFLVNGAGNVGIDGTPSASAAKLDVEGGSVQANPATSGTTDSAIFFRVRPYSNGVLDFGWTSASANGTWIQARDATSYAANYNLLLNPNGGNVGIGGTGNPGYTLTVNGTASVTSGAWSASDARLKKNIVEINDGLGLLEKLRAVRFNWRTPEEREIGKDLKLPVDRPQIGFIAQEVQKVVPEAVTKGVDGTYSLQETKIAPVLVKAVQQVYAMVRDLSVKVADLVVNQAKILAHLADHDGRLAALEQRLDKLQAENATLRAQNATLQSTLAKQQDEIEARLKILENKTGQANLKPVMLRQ